MGRPPHSCQTAKIRHWNRPVDGSQVRDEASAQIWPYVGESGHTRKTFLRIDVAGIGTMESFGVSTIIRLLFVLVIRWHEQ